MDYQHITAKVYTREGSIPDFAAFTPVFHSWIQRREVKGVTLIDVADYTHVPNGPGVVLVALEGHYAMEPGDAPGLRYSNKRGANGSLSDRVRSAVGRAIAAAAMIEAEPSLGQEVQFETSHLRLVVDDRLLAPNTDETFQTLAGDVQSVMDDLFGAGSKITRVGDDKAGLTIDVVAGEAPSIADLAKRCGQ